MHITPELARRFWVKVDIGNKDACWNWRAGTFDGRYGAFGPTPGKAVGAHRVSWELTNGPIPDGLVVCHKCDNRLCVNPDHLFLGTSKQNSQDMVAKARQNKGEDRYCAKLTTAQVSAIRLDPRPQRAIAQDYGVSQTLVQYVKSRRNWKHVA